MNITISERRNIEFYFLLIALGTLQAYRYNCIDLDTLESLIYRMKMLSIIDKNNLSSELEEIVLRGMGLEDVEAWVKGTFPSMLLVDTIDTIEIDCKSLLMDPKYYSCFTDFKLFEFVDDTDLSFKIDYISLANFEFNMMIFLLGFTLLLREIDDELTQVLLSFKDNILSKIKNLSYKYSESFDDAIELFDLIDFHENRFNPKRQQLLLKKISIKLRVYFVSATKEKIEADIDFYKSDGLLYYVEAK